MLNSTRLLGVRLTNETTEDILKYTFSHLKTANHKLFIVTPNPEILVYASRHNEYRRLLNEANLSLPDGIGVYIASGLLGEPLKGRVPGVDFMEEFCRASNGKTVSIGLLGGRQGVAKRTAECLKEKYPWVRIAFANSEWPDSLFDLPFLTRSKQISTAAAVFEELFNIPADEKNPAAIDMLFVAFGFPKQEEWIYKNLDRLPVKAAMGVGGAFDYISGDVRRAPYLIRAMGFEWLFRLIKQPWRLKRQLALVEFMRLVVKEKFRR